MSSSSPSMTKKNSWQLKRWGKKLLQKRGEKTSLLQLQRMWNLFSLRLMFWIIRKNSTTKEIVLVFYPTEKGVKNFWFFCVEVWIVHDLNSLKLLFNFVIVKHRNNFSFLVIQSWVSKHLLTFSRGGRIQSPMRDQISKNSNFLNSSLKLIRLRSTPFSIS